MEKFTKKRKKIFSIIFKILLVVFVIIVIRYIILISIIMNASNDNNPYNNYNDIAKYVNENYEELEHIAIEYINGNEVEKPKYVRSISVHSPNELYVHTDNTIVEFDQGGSGLVSSSTYYGFYYSENDIPAAFQNSSKELTEYEKNKWSWKGTDDNHGSTIKIRDNWYYFEASF